MTDNQLLVDTSDVVHIDNEETIIGTKTFSRDTVVKNLSPMMTNCITEIPQDIKLELNNGTLTLKAGSKVYVPNGVGVFDVVDITSDKTLTHNMDGSFLIFVNPTSKYMYTIQKTNCISGSNRSLVSTWSCWYDTTNNVINHYTTDSSIVTNIATFPIAEVTVSNNAISSIDQIFNGFGYIGSTVFALPGVKGLIPNGRNEDGTLKNIEYVNTIVRARTFTWDISGSGQCFALTATRLLSSGTGVPFYQQEETPSGRIYAYWYKPSENIMYSTGSGTTWNKADLMVVGKIVGDDTGKITSFTQKRVFSSLDYNDKSTVSGWSMPSNRYIDLTVGTSGTQYVAPANGWFYFGINANAAGAAITISGNNMDVTQIAYASGNQLRRIFPAKQGDSIQIKYSNSTASILRFIYAQGEI